MELVFRDARRCPGTERTGCYQQFFNYAHKKWEREKNSGPLAGKYLRTGSRAQMEKVSNDNCCNNIENFNISDSVPMNIDGDFD